MSTSSNLRVCALLLIGADVIRPSLDWVLTPRAPQNLVAVMARARDPRGFAELSALCAASPAGRTMKTAALRRAATILAVKGGTLREITVGDCLELSLAIDGRSLRANKAMGFYQLLHEMGVFSPDAPSTFRAFGTTRSAQPGAADRPLRHHLPPGPRRPRRLPGRTAADARPHHPAGSGVQPRRAVLAGPGTPPPRHRSLHLPPEVAAAWKQRVLTKTRQVVGPDGQTSEVQERRAGGLHNLAAVRAFYLDIAQWAMEDPPDGRRGRPRARSAPRTWPGRRRSAPASRGWTSAPGNGSRSCPCSLTRVNDARTTDSRHAWRPRSATARTSAAAGTARHLGRRP